MATVRYRQTVVPPYTVEQCTLRTLLAKRS